MVAMERGALAVQPIAPDRKDVPELMTQYVRMALGVGDDMEHLEATQVVRGALHIHVELIRIHPFQTATAG